MKNKFIISAMLLMVSVGAGAAQLVSKDEVSHYKLTKIGTITVMDTQGAVGSPSDLHDELSKKADEKGGKYYVIIAAREHGPNFEAVAEVYK